jgi:hypothetical protein
MIAKHGALLVALAAIALAAFVRLRLADVPLERDEGEYAYAGRLILKGIPPYLKAYNMKFPGTYYAYAMIMALLGETARAIHLGLSVVNAGTALVVFAIAPKRQRGSRGTIGRGSTDPRRGTSYTHIEGNRRSPARSRGSCEQGRSRLDRPR